MAVRLISQMQVLRFLGELIQCCGFSGFSLSSIFEQGFCSDASMAVNPVNPVKGAFCFARCRFSVLGT